jgi:hypothetical protein
MSKLKKSFNQLILDYTFRKKKPTSLFPKILKVSVPNYEKNMCLEHFSSIFLINFGPFPSFEEPLSTGNF